MCHTWRFSFCAAQASIQPWFMAGSVVVFVLEMHVGTLVEQMVPVNECCAKVSYHKYTEYT